MSPDVQATIETPATRPRLAWRDRILAGAVLVAIALIAYFPALRASYIFDDDAYVTNNPAIVAPDGLHRIWFDLHASPQYYPLVFTTFWIEHRLWGFEPLGYHLVNILLQGIDAILLWMLLRRLALPGAWLAAAIFAIHPVYVESVAWVTERKNVLSAVFLFLAIMAYLRFAMPSAERRQSWMSRALFYVLAIVLFQAALLSKTTTSPLPAALLVILWWQRGRLRLTDLLSVLPMAAMSIVMVRTTATVEHYITNFDLGLSPVERVLIAGHSFWFYLGKLVWPLNLCFVNAKWSIDTHSPWPYLYPLGAAALVVTLWLLRRRVGRGPLACVLLFGGVLMPALGLIQFYWMRYSYVADHLQYLAAIAPIAGFAALLARTMNAAGARGEIERDVRGRLVIPWRYAIVAATLLSTLGALTWRQARIYHDPETLYTDTLHKNPAAWMAYNNLGTYLSAHGRKEEAEALFLRSVELYPEHIEGLLNLASAYLSRNDAREAADLMRRALRAAGGDRPEVHNLLGLALLQQNRPEDAAESFTTALRLSHDFAAAHVNLGKALIRLDRIREAEQHLRYALRLTPDDPEAHGLLGDVLIAQGKTAEAWREYEAAARSDPRAADVHLSMGRELMQQGRVAEALPHLQMAQRTQPESPESNAALGLALAQLNRIDEALPCIQKVVQLTPDSADAHNNLGNLYARARRLDQAAAELREAVRLNPNLIEARANLGAILFNLGQVDEAIATLRDAIRRRPDFTGAYRNLGRILEAKGRDAEARDVYQAGLQIAPNDALLQEALRAILTTRPAASESAASGPATAPARP